MTGTWNPMQQSYETPTRCVCSRPIRHPRPDEGIDLDWIHDDDNLAGSAFCYEGGVNEETGEWEDPPFAEPAPERHES